MSKQPQGAYQTTVTLLAPAPLKTYRQATARVKQTSETAYRIASKRVRNIRELDADRVALETDQGDRHIDS